MIGDRPGGFWAATPVPRPTAPMPSRAGIARAATTQQDGREVPDLKTHANKFPMQAIEYKYSRHERRPIHNLPYVANPVGIPLEVPTTKRAPLFDWFRR